MNAKGRSALAAGFVGILVACTVRTATAQAPTDACKLLTQAQVSHVLGVNVGAGAAIGKTGCGWEASGGENIRLAITVHDATAWDMMKTPIANIPKVPASGIGDDAFYATVSTLTTLSVKKGKVAFVLHLYGIEDPAKQKSMARALALDVIAHL